MAEIIVDGGMRQRFEDLVGRRREVRVVVVLVMAAAVVALILWVRGAPATIAPPATSGEAFGPAMASPQTPAGNTVVHVGGAVKRAGIFELEPGARVADALELAVPRANADLNALNLAEVVTDGAKIDVPRRGEAVASAPGNPTPATPSTGAAGATVNINTADASLLDTIPEVGPATAQAIIEYRTQIGTFTSVEQLIEVSGIGPATLEAMRPFVTV
ncbi:MAG: helix-hairpin-helix domain-containing protein [Actinomycetota bacterium]